MSIAKLNARRKAAGLPLIRFDVRRLSPEDLHDLRDAFAAMYEITAASSGDRRGYWGVARGHGFDLDLCHNDDRVFLTWHRAYVYSFEKALNAALQWKRNDLALELTLPFWNWTVTDPATDAANGIPRALDDATYTNAAGIQQPNPLKSAPSMYRAQNQGLPAAQQNTQRFPVNFRSLIPQLANDVARLLDNPSFAAFSTDLDASAHGAVHVVVGGQNAASPLPRNIGDLGSVVSAAFDPIFWFHHSMVDKIWFDWQSINANATIPAHVRDTAVYDGFLGSALLDAERSLRYIYSDEDVEAAEEVGGTAPPAQPGTPTPAAVPADPADAAPSAPSAPPVAAQPPPPAPPPTVPAASPPTSALSAVLRIGDLRGGFRRAQLDFHQLRPPKASYEIRAFVNNADASDETRLDDPSYCGRLVLFGHGDCHGAKGHCNPALAPRDDYDLRDPHPLRYQHTKYAIDVTRGLRRALKGVTLPKPIEITLVTLDVQGKAVPQSSVRYGGVSLSTR